MASSFWQMSLHLVPNQYLWHSWNGTYPERTSDKTPNNIKMLLAEPRILSLENTRIRKTVLWNTVSKQIQTVDEDRQGINFRKKKKEKIAPRRNGDLL